jgi:hypothetical protein
MNQPNDLARQSAKLAEENLKLVRTLMERRAREAQQQEANRLVAG